MEKDKLQSIIESLLFASGDPISIGKLAKIAGVKNEEVAAVLDVLVEKYAKMESGLVLLLHGEKAQLATRADNSEFIEQLRTVELSETLSPAALEVLSIVAYRGPISKSEIEAIRGVNCSYTVRNLLLRGLIERNDNPHDARGYIYSITFDFLKKLGVDKVEKLPQYDMLSKDERIAAMVEENSEIADVAQAE